MPVNTYDSYGAEQRSIDRRRKLAEMLLQQSQTPIQGEPTPAGGYVVPTSWTHGLAKALQGGLAGYDMRQADESDKALTERYTTERGNALASALAAGRGTPASSENIVDEQQESSNIPLEDGGQRMEAINAPAVAGSRQAMLAQLMNSKFPDLQSAGMAQLLKEGEQYTLREGASRFGPNGQVIANNPKPAQGFTLAPGGTRFDAAGKPIANLPEKAPKDEGAWGDPYQMGGAWVQKNDTTGQVRQSVSREPSISVNQDPPITAVTLQDPKNPNATIIVDGRSGRVIGAGPKLSAVGGAEQKLSLGMPAAKLRVESMGQNLDRLDSALNTLHDNKGLTNITGTIMGRTPNITNTATGAQAQLNSIKSQIFQSSLQAMREASKTGGAVGNVSDREGDKLERTIAALDQAQGTPDFKKQLKKAVDQVRLSKELIDTAFQEQYGGVESRNGTSARSPNAAKSAVDAALEKYR